MGSCHEELTELLNSLCSYYLFVSLLILTGDSRRIHFEPYFKAMYTLIVFGLFTVALRDRG